MEVKDNEMKTYTVTFYREMLCEMDISARTIDEAELLFREGYLCASFRRVEEAEVVDEVVSIERCAESSKQISLMN